MKNIKEGHPHAKLCIECGKDLLQDGHAFLKWEHRCCNDGEWRQCYVHPIWDIYTDYRRKPERLQFTVDIPAPIPGDEDIPEGAKVWSPNIYAKSAYRWAYSKSNMELKFFQSRGLLFRTEEDAIEFSKAVIPFKG